MNERGNTFFAFLFGIILGVILCIASLFIFQATPPDQTRRDRQEAVDHGYAQWIATTNGEIEFRWKTNLLDNHK